MKTLITLSIVILITGCAHNKIQFVKLKSTEQNSTQSNSIDQIANHNLTSVEDERTSLHNCVPYHSEATAKKPKIELSLPVENKTITKPSTRHVKVSKSASVNVKTVSYDDASSMKELKKRVNGDAYIFVIAGLIALSSFGIAKAGRKTTLKVSRWASKNKNKTKVVLTIAQIGLGFLGYQTGFEMKNLGYEVSNNAQYITGGIGGVSYLALFLNDLFVKEAWVSFFRRKFGMAIVGASLFATSLGVGNGLETNMAVTASTSYLAELLSAESQEDAKHDLSPEKTIETKNLVKLKIGLYIFFAILLGLVLLVGGCLAICYLGNLGIVIVVLAVLLYILFNILMMRSINKSKRQLAAEMDWLH